ncbi:Intraflagellar transport protein 46-like protein [Frankliniella fusca]|uniref:Intraflagellar transport protein 46 homolog n=1 Tax=Frankliniella fusca TaxID=407009 RepID=A0AAE1LF21_9NEOP|nr:Intraflagellar transport protein 46-like protein [Frankliniella fusca]
MADAPQPMGGAHRPFASLPMYGSGCVQMYDESIDVSDAEEVATPPPSVSGSSRQEKNTNREKAMSNTATIRRHSMVGDNNHRAGSSDQSDNTDDDEDDDDVKAAHLEGSYDPQEFAHLPVSSEVKELFQNITRYTPQKIDLDFKLRPFVPDFIPAVGDIDAFLKVQRPDGKSDGIGLKVLDEPCAAQSEPAVLHLQLRALTKQSSAKAVVVKRVEDAERNGKAIEKWIRDISDLHRSKPPPTVHYSRPMPDIDNLLQEWPPEIEEKLNQFGLPTAQLDTTLTNSIDIICGLLDIPVYESRIQSLHVLFSLYIAVKNAKQGSDIN